MVLQLYVRSVSLYSSSVSQTNGSQHLVSRVQCPIALAVSTRYGCNQVCVHRLLLHGESGHAISASCSR